MSACIFALLSMLVASHETRAYPTPVDFDGSLLRWNIDSSEERITYEIQADRDYDAQRFASIIDDAAALWSEVPTSYFAFEPFQGEASGDTAAKAHVTIHLKRHLDGSAYSAGYAIFDEYDGFEPKHCSIYIYVSDGYSDTSMAKTFLHELGHCAGLGHTLIPEAIMSYRLEQNGFALDVDDRAAISRLYPADGSAPKLPPGCAVGSLPAGASNVALMLLTTVPVLLSLVARKYPRA